MSTGDCDSTVEHKDESAHNNLVNISSMHELKMMPNCQWFGASWKWNWEQ